MDTTSSTKVESAVDTAQFMALLNPILGTRPYISFLTANAGWKMPMKELIPYNRVFPIPWVPM